MTELLRVLFSDLRHVAIAGLLAAVLALGAHAWTQGVRLKSAQADVRLATAANAELRTTAAALAADIEAQNAAVAAAQAETDRIASQSARAATTAARALATAQARAERILQAPEPPDCRAAIQFLVDDAAGRLP